MTCTKSTPQALSDSGHRFPLSGQWGVLIGVVRCEWCGVVASERHFALPKEETEREDKEHP